MTYCSNCGHQLADGAKFCFECSAPIDALKTTQSQQRNTVYDGDLHKCPKCGEHLNAFVTICPVCNYELRGTQATSCVHELSLKLEKAETDQQKRELISNFYIPNTKEDIYEFFILAYSNITAGSDETDAWSIKLEQAYLKAKLSFGRSEEFACLHELYEKLEKTTKRRKPKNANAFRATILLIAGALIASASLLIEEILNEYDIVMYEALYPISVIGFICFGIGLLLLILSFIKFKKRANK